MDLRNSRVGQRAKEPIRRLIMRYGYDLLPLSKTHADLVDHLLRAHHIDWLIDVGANQGQYSLRMQALGFTGRIDSFEPGSQAFQLLSARASAAGHWHAHRLALGRAVGEMELQVSENSVSSSLLRTEPLHLEAAPDSRTRLRERVAVRPLDEVVGDIDGHAAWLKVDTQGFEAEVLAGAARTLARTRVLQLELSLAPLYAGQPSYVDVLTTTAALGFRPVDILPGFRDPRSGVLLQCDALLAREA